MPSNEPPDPIAALSPQQRSALTLLIGDASELMRARLVAGFRAPTTPPATPAAEQNTTPAKQNAEADEEECEKLQSELEGMDLQRGNEDNTEKERGRGKEKEKEKEKEKDKEKNKELDELQRDAVGSFDAWRDGVLKRVCEVVNTPAPPTSPSTPPPPAASEEDEDTAGIEFVQTHYGGATTDLPRASGPVLLQSLLLLLLSLTTYDARSRVLLLHIAAAFHLPLSALTTLEATTATGLVTAAMSATDERAQRADASKTSKRWKVGLASLGGAVLIGVTGGLAAPLVAAGLGTVFGALGLGATAAAGYLGAVAGSSALVGAMFGAYGARMTGQMAARYAAEVEDFAFLPVAADTDTDTDTDSPRLRVAVGVTGWLVNGTHDVVDPWRSLDGRALTAYALRWETSALLDLGESLHTILSDAAFSVVSRELVSRTVFATLYAALWPLALLKAARVLDNPFSIARARSEKAGRVLADALINRAQGERPVTLIGYSLGARVVHSCLQELAHRRAFGIVENVVLLGAPVPADSASWRRSRAVVAGRLVNVFSSNDYVLAFLYRTSSLQFGVAGLQKVGVSGVEEVDLGRAVEGHLRYREKVAGVLRRVLHGDVVVAAEVVGEDGRGEVEAEVKADVNAGVEKGSELDRPLERAEKRLAEMRAQREPARETASAK